MSRLSLIVALATGVALLGSTAEAAPKKKRKKARVSARAPKLKKTNMPRGFEWPPSSKMRRAARRCEAELDRRGVKWKRTEREGRIAAAVVVPGMRIGGIQYTSTYQKPPHKLDCHLALVLAEIGPTLYDLGVRQVRHGSIYRWSNVRVNGTTKPFLSRHALGIAMDIVSFVDENGRVAVVGEDYAAGDPLLLAIEDAVNASGRFRTVLTPKNDPASHDDHFHLEAAVDYTSTTARK